MRVIPPLEITPARLTSTSVYEGEEAGYDEFATYAAGVKVSDLDPRGGGLRRIWVSLQNGNYDHPLESSTLWWKYLGSSYPYFTNGLVYQSGERVIDAATNLVYESVVDDNHSRPLDNSPPWALISETNTEPTSSTLYAAGTTYVAGAFVYTENAYTQGGAKRLYYVSLSNGNIGNTPASSPAYWRYVSASYFAHLLSETYPLDGIVSDGVNSAKIYKSAIANNRYNPLTVEADSWVLIGKSNQKLMFDARYGGRTESISPLVVVITPAQRVDAIDLSNLSGVSSVRIVVTSGASTVYDETVNLTTRNITSYYSWFFTPFSYRKSVTKFDLPPVSSPVITVTFTGSGTVGVGSLILGSQFYVGQTQYNAVRDYINYSTVTRDFDGTVATLVQRSGIPKTSQTIWVDKGNVKGTVELLQSLDATPAVWSGLDDDGDGYYEPLHIVGIVKSAPIDVGSPTFATLNLELEAISPY
jgi:hypothetical protein